MSSAPVPELTRIADIKLNARVPLRWRQRALSLSAFCCGVCVVSWDQRFDRPVVLPDGKTLRTLEDARQYILTLPKSEHETTAWQVAIEALLIAAEKRDPGAGISEPRQA